MYVSKLLALHGRVRLITMRGRLSVVIRIQVSIRPVGELKIEGDHVDFVISELRTPVDASQQVAFCGFKSGSNKFTSFAEI